MLKLRRGTVVAVDPLLVDVDGERRPAWSDPTLVGGVREGDEVIVNVEALDLELGSGGFDVVHANLSRLDAPGADGSHVMKLNYTSLQHPVAPVERAFDAGERRPIPVLVLPLHGHLAPAAWAAAAAAPGLRIGFAQTVGGALSGSLSRDVAELRGRGLLCDHITAGAAFGGEGEAISTIGALDAAAGERGWEAAIVGPGPGILGSETRYGHGGIAALDSGHAALALGLPTLLSPRLSAADPRERHRGVSHHTRTVLDSLLAPVEVACPRGERDLGAELKRACRGRHSLREADADLDGYLASGLPASSMGRPLEQDPAFFAAALAAGGRLAQLAQT